jgi:glutathione S-transferase/RNA polymerase-associated protein
MIEDVMDSLYEPNNWGVMEVTRFKRCSGALADKLVGFAKSNIDQLQHWLDAQLGAKPWFNGDSFGWGDIACAPYINRSAAYGYMPPAGSQLANWFARVNERPSVAKVIDQMKQVLANMPDMAALLEQGKIKRQYRDHRLEWMIASGGLSVVQEGIEKGTIRFSRLPR